MNILEVSGLGSDWFLTLTNPTCFSAFFYLYRYLHTYIAGFQVFNLALKVRPTGAVVCQGLNISITLINLTLTYHAVCRIIEESFHFLFAAFQPGQLTLLENGLLVAGSEDCGVALLQSQSQVFCLKLCQ